MRGWKWSKYVNVCIQIHQNEIHSPALVLFTKKEWVEFIRRKTENGENLGSENRRKVSKCNRSSRHQSRTWCPLCVHLHVFVCVCVCAQVCATWDMGYRHGRQNPLWGIYNEQARKRKKQVQTRDRVSRAKGKISLKSSRLDLGRREGIAFPPHPGQGIITLSFSRVVMDDIMEQMHILFFSPLWFRY